MINEKRIQAIDAVGDLIHLELLSPHERLLFYESYWTLHGSVCRMMSYAAKEDKDMKRWMGKTEEAITSLKEVQEEILKRGEKTISNINYNESGS